MFTLQKPTFQDVQEYLWQQRNLPLAYEHPRATLSELPADYDCDRHRVRLGIGRRCFLAARRAMEQWKMFPLPIAELFWPGPIEVGTVVGILIRTPGLWSLNPCRIVYVLQDTVQEHGFPIDRYGFAYGTLADHVERGEVRFAVEYRRQDESVWYEIYSFSKPQHWLARATYPYCRWKQSRFRTLSGRAMQQAVDTLQ